VGFAFACVVLLVTAAQASAETAATNIAAEAPATASAPPQAAPVTPPLRVVGKQVFCARLKQMFANYGVANGLDHVQTTLLATNASAAVVQEFQHGRATDFVSAAALAQLANVPNRAPPGGYLPLAGFVAAAMGLPSQNVTLALSSGELRFIPFAQKGMNMVVIAQNAAPLTPERARKVAEVARSLRIHISVVWVGTLSGTGEALGEARSLAWLAAVTGGSFANLAGPANPCATDIL